MAGAMNQGQRRSFVQRYDFPAHLFAGFDFIIRSLSTAYCTWRTKLVLRSLGCPYGANLRVDGPLIIRAPRKGAVQLGDNVTFLSRFRANLVGMTNPTVLQCLGDGSIRIGNQSGCSSTVFSCCSSIRLGDHVNIGGNVRIYDHDFHPIDAIARRDAAVSAIKSEPVVIGDDVFIGTNAIILKGVHIGDRSVIGAGAVVALKEIPPDSLVAGNPARVIRSLKP